MIPSLILQAGSLTFCARFYSQSTLIAAFLWLGMMVCGPQIAQASCGDYLLMDNHARISGLGISGLGMLGAELPDQVEWLRLSSTEAPAKSSQPCHGPECRQAPAKSIQGLPAPSSVRWHSFSLATIAPATSMHLEDEFDLCALAYRLRLSTGFPEGIFRPPVVSI